MKIGILTHQYINNYGAFLQAWALREAIAELFPNDEVQIIDYVNLKHFIINAKKNDLKIIGAGDYKTFYDEGFIDLTPYEWVDLFRNAEKVITGTFHGTVFSIKYNKSVLCYPTEKNRINKIRSLLSDMKIASRLLKVGCEDEFIPLLDTPMDYTETRNYIAQKIQEADDFLTGDKS